MTDFTDKQHFLNTVYERFFQGYSVKLADTHGHRLHAAGDRRFHVRQRGRGAGEGVRQEALATRTSTSSTPAPGTGNFIVNLIRRIPKANLQRVYKQQLFANEIMLLPYYIAALNIEHAYYEQTGKYEPFEGLCFVDTLDLAEHAQTQLRFMTRSEHASVWSGRSERRLRSSSAIRRTTSGRQNENDNNKNRKYDVIDRRIQRHVCDGLAGDASATALATRT